LAEKEFKKSMVLDLDECMTGLNNCSTFAYCANVIGSYNCSCKEGFQGDGYLCKGKCNIIFYFLFNYVVTSGTQPGLC